MDYAAFRTAFPAFKDVYAYSDETLQAAWDAAQFHLKSPVLRANQLMVANLLWNTSQSGAGISGAASGLVQSASIDSVSITMSVPPVRSAWQAWLMKNPYGMELLVWIQSQSSGGFYVGGSTERQAFRRVGGNFGY